MLQNDVLQKMKMDKNKTRNRAWLVLAAILFSIIIVRITGAGNADIKKDKSRQETMSLPPKNIVNIIKKACPTCDIVSLNDLAEEAKSEYLEMYPNGNPGWIKGDFNGDGFIDYALLLRNMEDDKAFLRLVVLLSSDRKFVLVNLIEKYMGHSYWYLGLMPAGTVAKHTDAFDPPDKEPSELKLKFPAIEYYKAGSSMNLYYFEKNIFNVMTVSD